MANNVLLADDNFSSGSLASGWSAAFGSSLSSVSSGPPYYAEPPNTSTTCDNIWTGLTWPNDHLSELTVQSLTSAASTNLALWVRCQSGSLSGYVVNCPSGTGLTLYRCDSGSFTSLATASYAAQSGDVWSFQAAGAVLNFYVNGVLLIRWQDATYTGGAPGFRQNSGTAVSDSQVSSWRGYSAVQQDGIWQKQGVVLSPLSSDIDSGGGGVANASMLYEGNAQILSGNVYKMWFSAGGAGAENNCYYAESVDGINWSRYDSAILSNYGSPFIIKSGSVYYMYVQPSSNAGKGAFAVYTSSDGLNWTQQATNILSLGNSGAWDDDVMWYMQPVAIINGVWYALYSAGNNATSYQLSLGLATSSDGLSWTKYANNPVLVNPTEGSIVNGGALALVGQTYYMWFFGSQPNQGAVNPNLDPGEGIRYQTTDFINWTNPVHSVHHSEQYEGVNFVGGQCYPNGIFNINGKAAMYIQSAVSDGQGVPSIYEISLATGPASISSVVLFNEDGTTQIAKDSFTSGEGSLDSNWVLPTGGTALEIVSGPYVQPSETTENYLCQAVYTGAKFSENQYAEITIQTLTGSDNSSLVEPLVRASTTSITDYEGFISAGGATIYRRINGTAIQIGPEANCEPVIGDVWRLSVVNGTDGFPVLSLFQNGYLILQAQDQTSSALVSGNPGMAAYSSINVEDAQISSWAAGNAGTIPNYSNSSWINYQRHFVNKR